RTSWPRRGSMPRTFSRLARSAPSPMGRGSSPSSRHTQRASMDASKRVIVVGAGPVGLCLSLAMAQAGVQVCLIEALGEDNFLEQVPRAGTNHPATLELLERIGLYDKLEPRGIIAPPVPVMDQRRENQ